MEEAKEDLMFFIQKNARGGWKTLIMGHAWGNYPSKGFSSLEEAKRVAETIDVGKRSLALRIVDDNNLVQGWVGRNGFLPRGGLAPKTDEAMSRTYHIAFWLIVCCLTLQAIYWIVRYW